MRVRDRRQGTHGRGKLLALYDKGKKQQWDAATRIDWSQDLDPENPMLLDDRAVQIWGSPVWERLTSKERVRVRHHLQAQTLSQFMHGEQGALIATAKIVQTANRPDALPDRRSRRWSADPACGRVSKRIGIASPGANSGVYSGAELLDCPRRSAAALLY